MSTALIYDDIYLKHYAGTFHPERAERLSYTMEYLKKKGILSGVDVIKPKKACVEDIKRVHTGSHIDRIRDVSESGGGFIDMDTHACSDTYDVALFAAGGLMSAVDAVMGGDHKNSFALVRPPGHHATSDCAMGFCFFNNVAVAIKYAMEKYNLGKAFLLDWDAHAFNGTADIFYGTDSILDVSIHQDPAIFYPGTGFMHQSGTGRGKGYTVNIPVPPETGDADYIYIIDKFIIPAMRKFKPDIIFISSGIDSHKDDMISSLMLTDECYGAMTSRILGEAENLCAGRVVVELEGGYSLTAMARSNYEILRALLGEFDAVGSFGAPSEKARSLVCELKEKFPHLVL